MPKNEVQPEEIQSDTSVTVVEQPDALKLVNPYVEVQVHIHGLEPYTKRGLRAATLKTARAWMRARGVTVRLNGTVKEETPNVGKPFIPKGETEEVTPDLLVYRFTEECLLENDVEVTIASTPSAAKKPDSSEAVVSEAAVPVTEVVAGDTPEAIVEGEEAAPEGEEAAPKDW